MQWIQPRWSQFRWNYKVFFYIEKRKQFSFLGYSASDIKAIVKEACMEPLREFKGLNYSLIDESKLRAVELKDFMKALTSVAPSVSTKDMEMYKMYQKKFLEI